MLIHKNLRKYTWKVTRSILKSLHFFPVKQWDIPAMRDFIKISDDKTDLRLNLIYDFTKVWE